MSTESVRVIRLGRVTGAHGVKGWIKVHSFTQPRANILEYPRWLLEQHGDERTVDVEAGAESGRKLIAKLAGVDDRDAAVGLAGATIGVRRADMPALAPGEYYWADLEGLAVISTAGDRLGTVVRLLATGANDVLVLDSGEQHLIPFVRGQTVRRVDLDAGEIIVEWEASFWE